jgi:hypothetical protein
MLTTILRRLSLLLAVVTALLLVAPPGETAPATGRVQRGVHVTRIAAKPGNPRREKKKGPNGGVAHKPGRGHNDHHNAVKKAKFGKKAEKRKQDKEKRCQEAKERWAGMSEDARKLRPKLDPKHVCK